MSDQETGLRGYVLTEDKGFLKPLQDGETEAKAAQQRLTRLIGRNDAQSRRLDMLEQQVADWQGKVSAVILRDFGDPANAERVSEMIRPNQARDMMDGIRASPAAIEQYDIHIL